MTQWTSSIDPGKYLLCRRRVLVWSTLLLTSYSHSSPMQPSLHGVGWSGNSPSSKLLHRKPSSQMPHSQPEKHTLSISQFWRLGQDAHGDLQCHLGCSIWYPSKKLIDWRLTAVIAEDIVRARVFRVSRACSTLYRPNWPIATFVPRNKARILPSH